MSIELGRAHRERPDAPRLRDAEAHMTPGTGRPAI